MHLLASVKLLRARQKQIWFRLLALFKYESAILSFVKTGISMMVFLTAITWLWTLADEQKQRRTATTASSSIFIVIFWIPYLLGPIYRTINWRISKLRAEKVIYRRQIITIRYNVARAQSTTLRNTALVSLKLFTRNGESSSHVAPKRSVDSRVWISFQPQSLS